MFVAFMATVLTTGGLKAAISIDNLSTYTQDFNSLPTGDSGSALNWTNNSTIPGWYQDYSGITRNEYSFQVVPHATIPGLVASGGVSVNTSARFANLGHEESTDRSVGMYRTSSVHGAVGALFQNNTGQEMAGFEVGYTGEQWRRGGSDETSLYFEYAVLATDQGFDVASDPENWTRVDALQFNSIKNDGGGMDLDGKYYQAVIEPVTIRTTVEDGEYLAIRWYQDRTKSDGTSSSVYHMLAVNDVSFTPMVEVHISTFGAYPDDDLDDTAAINQAIVSVLPGTTILFDEGVYDLITPRDQHRHIYFWHKNNLTLKGAVCEEGFPQTTLLRHVTLENNPSPPRMLNIASGSNITIKNFILDNSPHLCSVGEITAIDPQGKFLEVQILDGLPMDDGAAFYAANVWEPDTLDLKEVESLTYGTVPGKFWSLIDEPNRIMRLEHDSGASLTFLNRVEVGELVSWHYGSHIGNKQPQIRVDNTRNLVMENLDIPNVINMGILIGGADGVEMRRITMRPYGNMLQVGPADGIHLSRCSGVIIADELDITGVRWDGYVVHAPYGMVSEIYNTSELRVKMVSPTLGQTVFAGSELRFLDSTGQIYERTVSDDALVQNVNGEWVYDVILSDSLPGFVGVGTYLKVESVSPQSVTVTNSIFENIGGSSLILLADNVTVSDTIHRKIMYSAVHIGANHTVGIAGDNMQIINSEFYSCGWMTKPGFPAGIITIRNRHNTVTNGILRNVSVRDNIFSDQLYNSEEPSIWAYDTQGLVVDHNLFENVFRGLRINTATVSGFNITETTVVIDNDENAETYREVSGNFHDSGLTGYNGSTTRWSGSPGATASWEFICPKSDIYDVYIYKVVHPNSDPNALISVEHAQGTAYINVDYTSGSSGWHYLGSYDFNGQGTYFVKNERQGGYLRSDSVVFVQQ